MTDNVKPFPAERIDSGYDTYSGDFRAGYSLTDESQNITVGFNLGAAPRFGMAPIPGHLDDEPYTATQMGGLMATENDIFAVTSMTMWNRRNILAIIPLTIATYDDLKIKKRHYFFITAGGTAADANKNLIACTQNIDRVSGNILKFLPNLEKGLSFNTAEANFSLSIPSCLGNRLLITANVGYTQTLENFLTLDSGVNYASTAVMSIPSTPQACNWIVGYHDPFAANGPNATDPGDFIVMSLSGEVSSFNLATYPQNSRPVVVYALSTGNTWLENIYYYSTTVFSSNVYKKVFWYQNTDNVKLKSVTPAPTVVPPISRAAAPASADRLLLNDCALTMDNAYQLICVAAKKPYAFFSQDWDRTETGTTVSCLDLTVKKTNPTLKTTQQMAGGFYNEDGVRVNTCFDYWPLFQSGFSLPKNSASAFDGIIQITLGEAGSGILRKDTVYEFTYAIFDKKLNYETNVGAPVKFKTGTDDFVALSLYRDKKVAGVFQQLIPSNQNIPVSVNSPLYTIVNQLNVRFYYRVFGSYEWLPALEIEAAQLYFYPDFQVLWSCTGDAVGSVGGQPGGFNDYSELAQDQYICCVAFKGRMFWLSKQNMSYSLINNPICYPLRNNFSVPSGEYRGAVIHQFRGESNLLSQLIVFGSDEVYWGDFTGQTEIAAVQISPDNVGQFPIDGSDFVMQTLTTNTAFSYRSAVSADGDLYYWGPQGIFVRKGTSKPEKISLTIEPELTSLYDNSKIDEIHCTYDSITRQITWFYPPKTADANFPTYGLSLDIDNGEFFPLKYAGKIDGSQKLTIEDDESPKAAHGDRTIVFSRASTAATVQRAYFYDHFCKSGDIYPNKEMLVKSFTTPTPGQRTFTLAAGYDAATLASIQAGDQVGVVAAKEYATSLTNAEPFIGTVVSVGVGTITLKLPDNVSFDASATLTRPEYFQLYAKNIHSFAAKIATKYWTPGGMLNYWYFLYLYGLFKLNPLLPSRSSQDLTIGYTTPLNDDNFESTLALRDNSRGNYQVYKALVQSHGYAQAIRFIIEEDHYAGSWVLQSLILMAQQQSSDEIKTYEE